MSKLEELLNVKNDLIIKLNELNQTIKDINDNIKKVKITESSKQYMKRKYLNDEIFREKTKERARQYYHIKKSKSKPIIL
jgi:ABC-type metal ion transport system substrate-binding protein